MANKSVYIVSGNAQYVNMFLEREWEMARTIAEADLILFTGGEDVTPDLYGERPHPKTYSNINRDRAESDIFKMGVELGIPMAGICRGGQFLNVMNGGKMWQHVNNHAISGTHKAHVTGFIGEIDVTSTHHQMMIPAPDDVESIVLVTANLSTQKERMGSQGVGIVTRYTRDEDVESIYYPTTHSLCFQPHPEFNEGRGQCRDVFFFFINNYLLANAGMDKVSGDIANGIIKKIPVEDFIPFN